MPDISRFAPFTLQLKKIPGKAGPQDTPLIAWSDMITHITGYFFMLAVGMSDHRDQRYVRKEVKKSLNALVNLHIFSGIFCMIILNDNLM